MVRKLVLQTSFCALLLNPSLSTPLQAVDLCRKEIMDFVKNPKRPMHEDTRRDYILQSYNFLRSEYHETSDPQKKAKLAIGLARLLIEHKKPFPGKDSFKSAKYCLKYLSQSILDNGAVTDVKLRGYANYYASYAVLNILKDWATPEQSNRGWTSLSVISKTPKGARFTFEIAKRFANKFNEVSLSQDQQGTARQFMGVLSKIIDEGEGVDPKSKNYARAFWGQFVTCVLGAHATEDEKRKAWNYLTQIPPNYTKVGNIFRASLLVGGFIPESLRDSNETQINELANQLLKDSYAKNKSKTQQQDNEREPQEVVPNESKPMTLSSSVAKKLRKELEATVNNKLCLEVDPTDNASDSDDDAEMGGENGPSSSSSQPLDGDILDLQSEGDDNNNNLSSSISVRKRKKSDDDTESTDVDHYNNLISSDTDSFRKIKKNINGRVNYYNNNASDHSALVSVPSIETRSISSADDSAQAVSTMSSKSEIVPWERNLIEFLKRNFEKEDTDQMLADKLWPKLRNDQKSRFKNDKSHHPTEFM